MKRNLNGIIYRSAGKKAKNTKNGHKMSIKGYGYHNGQ
jgi:hypothetical protein